MSDSMRNAEGTSGGADDQVLQRWERTTLAAHRLPAVDLLSAGRRPGFAARRAASGLAVVAVIVAAVAGVGAWMSLRGTAAPTSAIAVTTPTAVASGVPSSSPTASPSPLPTAPPVVTLLADEEVVGISAGGGEGALLTTTRLLVRDANGWRECWQRAKTPAGFTAGIYASFASASRRMVVDGRDLSVSDPRCGSWQSRLAPAVVSAASLAGDSVYVAALDESRTPWRVTVYRSDDAAAHWTKLAATVSSPAQTYDEPGVVGLTFADRLHGWVRVGGHLWQTADGGTSWAAVSPWEQAGASSMPVTVSVTGDPVASADGRVALVADLAFGSPETPEYRHQAYVSSDFGAHWEAASERPAAAADERWALASPTTMLVLDQGKSAVYATTNAGATWSTTAIRERWPFDTAQTPYVAGELTFADPLHGWLVLTEKLPCPANAICDYSRAPYVHVVETVDGGQTWHAATS